VIRGLIVFQFALAIMMLVSSVAVTLQMRYIAGKDLGFDKENLLVVPLPVPVAEGRPLAERFIEEAEGLPFISGITYTSAPPGAGARRMGYIDDQRIFRQFDGYYVGADFLSVMGMELIEGRTFRNDTFDSSRALIVNEAFLRDYGWEQGVGRRLPGKDFPEHEIVGVVRDANFTSLAETVRPMVFVQSMAEINKGITDVVSYSSPSPDLLIRTDLARLPELLPELKALWARIGMDAAFDYYVLETTLAALYRKEANFQEVVLNATAVAVFVAAIGLIAMAVLVTSRRTREIGVRKVMGGSVWSIVRLLTNDFSKMVLVANVIAWPVAYFTMTRWLENFAYRIDLTPLIFIGSGLIALCIAWVTVGGTAAKAATRKPVLALRYE
jgi:putative ABC transport system permease protein